MRRLADKQFPSRAVRRGAAIPLVAISSVVLVGMGALAIDAGVLYRARAELQASADAAALAAAGELLDNDRLHGGRDLTTEMAAARQQAIAFAAQNRVMGTAPVLDANTGNDPNGDIVCAYLSNPNDIHAPLSLAESDRYNTILVRVRRNQIRNGPIDLFFAGIFGVRSANLGAEAAACIKDEAHAFKTPDSSRSQRSPLLPIAVEVNAWRALVDGTANDGDHYAYSKDTKTVSDGPDGIPELKLYPGSGTKDNTFVPGNFGTVDLGSPDNSTSTLSRQILYGPSPEDFAYFGGQIGLGPDGTLLLMGDTGLSLRIKEDLEKIKGQARAIPIFSKVNLTGNNAAFTIIGFAGVRIMDVFLTSKEKELMIQPCFVVDETVITQSGTSGSWFVYEQPRLVR